MDKEEILSNNLLDDGIFFDFSSTTSNTNKSLIVAEIAAGLLLTTAVTELEKDSAPSIHKITNFMSYMKE